MSKANETRADILREMRDRAITKIGGRTITARNFVPQETVEDWADRIEAAAERERNRQYEPKRDWSVKDALALANTLANHGLRDGNADAASSCIYSLCRILASPGNAAAPRTMGTTIAESELREGTVVDESRHPAVYTHLHHGRNNQ